MNNLTILTLVLRLNALVLLLAIVPVFFPYSWMHTIHGWFDIGELPQQPIVNYLTRSLSLVYALHGAVCMALALNVKRYLDLIRILALCHVAMGAFLLVIDLQSGMPWYWTIAEGPMIMVFAIFVYFFSGLCQQEMHREELHHESTKNK